MDKIKIVYNDWIPAVLMKDHRGEFQKPGTGMWTKDYPFKGFLLNIGLGYEEMQDGNGGKMIAQYSTAIIQKEDNTLDSISIHNIKINE